VVAYSRVVYSKVLSLKSGVIKAMECDTIKGSCMKNFEVELESLSPMLHHRMTEDELFGLLGTKGKKKKQKEELTPRQIAEKYAYKTEDGRFYIPAGYICGAFAGVASEYKQKNSTRRSVKSIAGGVFSPLEEQIIMTDHEGSPLKSFEVDIRKATNHKVGAVAVCRPRFERWKVKFNIAVDDTLLDPQQALEILEDAGRRSGIGSFRVSKGGSFGKFCVTSWQETVKTN
jgi:hypothetical protein